MRIDRRFLAWGVFFVVLGAVPLAVRQGPVSETVIERAWDLWPLILVGIGAGLVLRKTPFEPVGGVIVAGTFGLILGSALATGTWRFGGFGTCGPADEATSFAPIAGTLSGDTAVTIQVDCGDLALSPAAGAGYRIEGEGDDGDGPRVDDNGGSLEIRGRDSRGFFSGSRDMWRMALGTDPTVRLDLEVDAGSARLDLSAMRIPELRLNVNAGDATVDLAEVFDAEALTARANAGTIRIALPVENLRGSVSANAGSIELCAPGGVGLRFVVDDNVTASYDFGRGGLVQTGGAWQSPDYATAEVKIELQATANAGSIVLNPEGGCDG